MTPATATTPEVTPEVFGTSVKAVIPRSRGQYPSVLICIKARELRLFLAEALMLEGYPTSMVDRAYDVADKVAGQMPDCVIFDVAEGTVDAIVALRQIGAEKEAGETSAVLAIVPPAAEGKDKRIKDMADEFMLMPFTQEEVNDRIDSAVDRCRQFDEAVIVVNDPLNPEEIVIDRAARAVKVGKREITLSMKEFDLLVMLARQPKTVFRKSTLMKEVWSWQGDISKSRTLEAHASRLRRKLDPDNSAAWVHSTRGYGLSLCRPS